MAHPGTRGHTQQGKQDQGAQQGRQDEAQQAQRHRDGNRSAHDAAWNFEEFVQQPPSSSRPGPGPGPSGTRGWRPVSSQAPRFQPQGGQGGQGLRRGLGDLPNSGQRGPVAMAAPPASTVNFNKSNYYSMAMNPSANASQSAVGDDQSSLGFSQAFALGVSIPTSKFNTEAFGTLSVRPVSHATSEVDTTGTNIVTEIGAPYDPESLDDDLELPLDIDDDFGILDDMNVGKESHGLGVGTGISQTGPTFGGLHPQPSQIEVDRVDDTQAVDEAGMLKQKLTELEAQLKQKQDELQIESGRASMLKDKLEDVSISNSALNEQFRVAQVQYQIEKDAMVEKHRQDLENANMNHQFEVSKYIMDVPSSSKGVKATQQPRLPPPPLEASFPKDFAGFFSTQSSVKAQARSDDGFSVQNFSSAPKSPRKSRSFGLNGTALEKPRPFHIAGETVRRTAFFSSDIPTQSDEEIIRDKLLAGHEHSYGMKQLLSINADEEQTFPLPGSQDDKKNSQLQALAKKCVDALAALIQSVTVHSRSEALKTTADLLRASLIIRKPLHTVNALQVLSTLCFAYEDLVLELCRGTVPFLENERGDPMATTPSSLSLSSALACIYYLFLTRIAMALPSMATPAFPAMRKEHELAKDAQKLLDANIFQLMGLVVRQQLESKTIARTFLPLVRLHIYDKLLNLHLELGHYATLSQALDIMNIVTQDADCSRPIVGWSITRRQWNEAFSQIDTYADLIEIQTKKTFHMANGVVPQLKIKVLEILHRLTQISYEQTIKIVYKTQLIRKIIYSIQSLVALAGEMQHQKVLGSIWREKDLETPGDLRRVASKTSSSSSGHTPGDLRGMASRTASSSSGLPTVITPKSEPFTAGPGTFSFPAPFSSQAVQRSGSSSTLPRTASTTSIISRAGPSSSNNFMPNSATAPETSFSSFKENNYDASLYKLSAMDATRPECGVGSRQVSALMAPHLETFDFVVLMKLELEFILNIIHAVPDYPRHLSERHPCEYRALAFAVSRIAIGELGLSKQSQELANDVLLDLMFDDEEENDYLELVREMYGIPFSQAAEKGQQQQQQVQR